PDCSPWTDKWPLDVMASLVDQSMVKIPGSKSGQRRFQNYESIRAYALEQLEQPGAITAEDGNSLSGPEFAHELRLRHARHFAELGSASHLESLNTHGGHQRQLALAAELENLHAATIYSIEHGQPDVAAQCAFALAQLFLLHGPLTRGIEILDRVGRLPDLSRESEKMLYRWNGTLCYNAGLTERASTHLTAALDMAQGDRHFEGIVRGLLANAAWQRGLWNEAEEQGEAALAIHRQEGNRVFEGNALANLGIADYIQGRLESACEQHRLALAIHHEAGNRQGEVLTRVHLANARADQGRNDEAHRHYQTALDGARELGNKGHLGAVLCDYGDFAHRLGRYDEARSHLEEALTLAREVGDRRAVGIIMGNLGELLLRLDVPDEAEAYLERAIDITDPTDTVVGGAARGSLALCRAKKGRFAEARELLAQGSIQLQKAHFVSELGILLCKAVLVEKMANDVDAAERLLTEAKNLAKKHGSAVGSDFARHLAELVDPEPQLTVGPEARWFKVGAAPRVDMSRRGPMRRLLAMMAQNPGVTHDVDAMFQAGWPGQNIQYDAATQRVYVAISRLRSMGLKDFLKTRDEGYYLDAQTIELADD
ncbi:MAG: tetratricopeptide repeat protein, partial [Proteobacteria bacterium]|nr:tetratricopeptide repeat protein [Pseudomonadota bacterium]